MNGQICGNAFRLHPYLNSGLLIQACYHLSLDFCWLHLRLTACCSCFLCCGGDYNPNSSRFRQQKLRADAWLTRKVPLVCGAGTCVWLSGGLNIGHFLCTSWMAVYISWCMYQNWQTVHWDKSCFNPAYDLEVMILSLARLLLLCWFCSCCCCWWWWWCWCCWCCWCWCCWRCWCCWCCWCWWFWWCWFWRWCWCWCRCCWLWWWLEYQLRTQVAPLSRCST